MELTNEMQVLIAQRDQEIIVETLEMFGGKNKETGILNRIIPYNHIQIKTGAVTTAIIPFIGIDIGITKISTKSGTILYENPNLKFLKKKTEDFDYCNFNQRKELFDHMNLKMRPQKFGQSAIITVAF